MDFSEVLSEIFDTKGWYQGENFNDGVYITIDDGMIVVRQFLKGFSSVYSWPLSITYGVTKMKYRRVYTQPDVERRV